MKKTFYTLSAILAFGIASAQVDPAQPQQTQPDPASAAQTGDTKNTADKQVDVQTDVNTRQHPETGVTPRKDEIKTTNHVKSTPDPAIAKDNEEKKMPAKKTKKRRRN